MPGATIDHMISVTILVMAMLVAMATFSNMFASAITYERNRQVSMKAVDLIDTICLSPGSPTDWGETNSPLLGFGLQDPQAGGYALSPFSIMRLKTSNNTSQLVYYPKTGLFYNNQSANFGDAIYTPVTDCINYSSAAELLGINKTYGFRVDVFPTVNVIISQVSPTPPHDHLILKVDVSGSALPLSDAVLNYRLFKVKSSGGGGYPSVESYSGVSQTDIFGSATIEFDDVHESNDPYSFIVYVSLSGLTGVGYYSHDTTDDLVIPFIEDYGQRTVIFAHKYDVQNSSSTMTEVKYNATFFSLTSDLKLQEVQIENSTGHLLYGEGNPYFTTKLPDYVSGILFVAYRRDANRMGSVMLPWGISTLGISASFGSDSTGYSFVATELRQLTISGISYQVKLSTWRLGG